MPSAKRERQREGRLVRVAAARAQQQRRQRLRAVRNIAIAAVVIVGVIFFLYRLKDVVAYVSLFTLGHSVTLLAGVLGGIHANPYLIDAVIGFSVVYKAFENMDGFRRFLGFQPNTKAAVLIFGLFHGFGLATKLQDFALSQNGLVANIVSFNVGVEIGQCLALTAILIALTWWRTRSAFFHHAFAFNGVVMACGFLLVGYQLSGYFLAV